MDDDSDGDDDEEKDDLDEEEEWHDDDFGEFLCIIIQSMLENDTREIETCCKTQYIRVSPVQSGQGPHQSPVFFFNLQPLV